VDFRVRCVSPDCLGTIRPLFPGGSPSAPFPDPSLGSCLFLTRLQLNLPAKVLPIAWLGVSSAIAVKNYPSSLCFFFFLPATLFNLCDPSSFFAPLTPDAANGIDRVFSLDYSLYPGEFLSFPHPFFVYSLRRSPFFSSREVRKEFLSPLRPFSSDCSLLPLLRAHLPGLFVAITLSPPSPFSLTSFSLS